MAKTLNLHIGHYKTGTTALQFFLAQNDTALRRRGLDYLRLGRHFDKHSGLAFSIYRAAGVTELMHGYAQNRKPADAWEAVFTELRNSRGPDFLVSSEEFVRMGAYPKATAILRGIIEPVRDEFNFRVIVYLRAPQSHLRSWYNQLVKMNQMPVPDFNTAVCQTMEPIHYDYALALRPWIDIFGPEAVIVRPYTERLRQGAGLFEDFLSIFDIPALARFKKPKEDLNPRLDDKTLEITRVMQLAGYSGTELAWAKAQVERIMAVRTAEGPRFDDVTTRAAAGLEVLGDLPGSAVDIGAFGQDLPRAEGRDLAMLADLLVHVLGDLQFLRRNLHQRQADLATRIAALEAQSKAPTDQPPEPPTEPPMEQTAKPIGLWTFKP